jgi:two-component system OmpR family sensor kinase
MARLATTFRGRLALAMTALSAGVLAAASVAIYASVRHTLRTNLDDALLAIVRAEVASSVDAPGGQVHVHEEGPLPIALPGSSGYEKAAEILDADRRVVARTQNLGDGRGLRLDSDLFAHALDGTPAFGDSERMGATYRAIYYPLRDVAGRPLVAVVGIPTRPLAHALAAVMGALTFALAVGSIAAAFGARRLAARLIRPLDAIADAADAVGEQSLHARIPQVASDRELGRLTAILNAMLARLEGAFAAQRRFVADASHELRSPLSNLRGTIEVALRRPRSPDEYRQTLTACLAEIARLARLVQGLLTLSRADAGVMTLARISCDLTAIARDSVVAHTSRAELLGVCLRLDAPASLPLDGDPDRLREVVDNLLDNGLRHAPRGSEIVVRAVADDGRLRVSVTDAGPGLSPETRSHVFERFYRADGGRDRASGGLGLGLSIAKAIAEAHGGQLTVDSVPGTATTFALILPAR